MRKASQRLRSWQNLPVQKSSAILRWGKVWEEVRDLQVSLLPESVEALTLPPFVRHVANLASRANRFLEERGVTTEEQIRQLTWENVCSHPTMGKKVWEKIRFFQYRLSRVDSEENPKQMGSMIPLQDSPLWAALSARTLRFLREREITTSTQALIDKFHERFAWLTKESI